MDMAELVEALKSGFSVSIDVGVRFFLLALINERPLFFSGLFIKLHIC